MSCDITAPPAVDHVMSCDITEPPAVDHVMSHYRRRSLAEVAVLLVTLVSVEDVLSHRVKKRYHASKSKPVTPSVKILHDIGKTYPDAASVYAKCFIHSSDEHDDYTVVQTTSPAERRILWIRVAMIDGKLPKIVGEILKRKRYR